MWCLLFLVNSKLEGCPPEFGSDERLVRCLVSDTVTFNRSNGVGTTVIYLHTNKKKDGTIQAFNQTIPISPGEGYRVQYDKTLTVATLTCPGCFVKVGHLNADISASEATYVSDAAGAVYKRGSFVLAKRYFGFFDFGENTFLYVNELVHNRIRGLDLETGLLNGTNKLYVQVGTTEQQTANTGDNTSVTVYGYPFEGPGLLNLSWSPFITLTVHITVGSKVKLPSEYTGEHGWGTLGSITSSGYDPCKRGKDIEGLVRPAKENIVWYYMLWVSTVLAAAILLVSCLFLILGIVDHYKDSPDSRKVDEP